MPISNLHGLAEAGVSVWSDQISKAMLDNAELERLVREDAVTGVTSNPTIFAGAIVGSDDYLAGLTELQAANTPPEQIVKTLMGSDIIRACDVLADVHRSTEGRDGHVSVEVSPTLANDTEATVAEAHDWVERINRPNLLVKVPATPAGIPAIRRLIADGVSINVTLIFSLDRYLEVIDAYLTGLEHLQKKGSDLASVTSVASFFVSRFDSEVDRRLDEIGSDQALALRGRTAVANAMAAYGSYVDKFEDERFEGLAAKGAQPQRPLWASTSTKNPTYNDLLYVENLVAPNTVNTMPMDTIVAYQDHGNPQPREFSEFDVADARGLLGQLNEVGVDYDDVVATLEREGVDKFVSSWHELTAAVRTKRT